MLLCFCVLVSPSKNCECDLLHIRYSDGQSSQNGDHYFTKQSEKIIGQPFYYSFRGDFIWWNNDEKSWTVQIEDGGDFVKNNNVKRQPEYKDFILFQFKDGNYITIRS